MLLLLRLQRKTMHWSDENVESVSTSAVLPSPNISLSSRLWQWNSERRRLCGMRWTTPAVAAAVVTTNWPSRRSTTDWPLSTSRRLALQPEKSRRWRRLRQVRRPLPSACTRLHLRMSATATRRNSPLSWSLHRPPTMKDSAYRLYPAIVSDAPISPSCLILLQFVAFPVFCA